MLTNMRKTLTAVVCLLVFGLALTGCSGLGNPPTFQSDGSGDGSKSNPAAAGSTVKVYLNSSDYYTMKFQKLNTDATAAVVAVNPRYVQFGQLRVGYKFVMVTMIFGDISTRSDYNTISAADGHEFEFIASNGQSYKQDIDMVVPEETKDTVLKPGETESHNFIFEVPNSVTGGEFKIETPLGGSYFVKAQVGNS
jgi:hypothetical protein